jgi:HAD superfamily hydrolase (TIGR01509 family)
MNRAIIFDVDGTLAETEETHRRAFNRAFERAGLVWRWDQRLYGQLLAVTGGKERIRYFIEALDPMGVPPGGLDDFIRLLHADKTHAYAQLVGEGELVLRPGIRELIATARRKGYRLALATTTTPANIDALLAATFDDGGRDLFEVICAGDSVPSKKPAPDVYLKTLEELDLPAANCIAVEDSRNGLQSAIGAGIPTIVTPGIYTHGEDFSGAAIVVDHLEALDFAEIDVLFAA